MTRKTYANIRIVCDGTAQGTHVLVGNVPMSNVTEVVINPITIGCDVTATITIENVTLDMVAAAEVIDK